MEIPYVINRAVFRLLESLLLKWIRSMLHRQYDEIQRGHWFRQQAQYFLLPILQSPRNSASDMVSP